MEKRPVVIKGNGLLFTGKTSRPGLIGIHNYTDLELI